MQGRKAYFNRFPKTWGVSYVIQTTVTNCLFQTVFFLKIVMCAPFCKHNLQASAVEKNYLKKTGSIIISQCIRSPNFWPQKDNYGKAEVSHGRVLQPSYWEKFEIIKKWQNYANIKTKSFTVVLEVWSVLSFWEITEDFVDFHKSKVQP